MTVLIIIAALALLIVIILFLPISVQMKYEDDFFLKIRAAGIKVYEVEPEKDIKKPAPSDTESDKKAEEQGDNLFERLKKKLGFFGTIKEIIAFIKALLEKIGRTILKHVLFKRFTLDITVAAEDAATTALEYGAVCTAVYPVLSYISGVVSFKMKQINIISDFDSGKPDFKFSCIAKTRLVFLLSAVFAGVGEYNKFKIRNEL